MELFSLLAIVLGILGGFKLMGLALIYLGEHFDIDKNILPYVAFAVVFLAIVLIVTLVGRMLKSSIDKSFLGTLDQAAGSVLGLVKTIFLVSVGLWIAESVNWEFPSNWTENSMVLPYVEGFAPMVTSWISEVIPAFNDIF